MEKRAWIKSNGKKIAAFVVVIPCLALAIFWFYVQWKTYPATPELLELIQDNEEVMITEEGNYFILSPYSINPDHVPIIYYPGGLVAPEAYLYKLGYIAILLETSVYLIKAPFNAAIFNVRAAGKIIEQNKLGKVWVGGHSLGGISAARFTAQNQGQVFGLFLFASYSDQDITTFEGKVLSVMGVNDGIIDWENYQEAKGNLPNTALLMEIDGLNHSDFGNYGLQKGDGVSSLHDESIIEIIYSLFEILIDQRN